MSRSTARGSSLCPVPSAPPAPAPAADEVVSVGGLLLGRGSVVAAILAAVTSSSRTAEHSRARQSKPCFIIAVTYRANVLLPQMFLYKGEPYCRYFLVDSLHGSEIVLKSDSEKPQLKTAVEKPTKTTGKEPNSGQQWQKVAISL